MHTNLVFCVFNQFGHDGGWTNCTIGKDDQSRLINTDIVLNAERRLLQESARSPLGAPSMPLLFTLRLLERLIVCEAE